MANNFKKKAGAWKKQQNEHKLELSDCICPICMYVLIEPVTMPCGHDLCLPCFGRYVHETSLFCPVCRLRIASWTRRATRNGKLVNQQRWKEIQEAFPKKVKCRLQNREDDYSSSPEMTEDDVFVGGLQHHLAETGEVRKEYEDEMKKLQEERLRQQNEEEDASQKLIQAMQAEEFERQLELERQQLDDEVLAKQLADKMAYSTPSRTASSTTSATKTPTMLDRFIQRGEQRNQNNNSASQNTPKSTKGSGDTYPYPCYSPTDFGKIITADMVTKDTYPYIDVKSLEHKSKTSAGKPVGKGSEKNKGKSDAESILDFIFIDSRPPTPMKTGGINTSYGVKIETHGQEGPLVFGDQSDHLLRAQPSLGFEKSNTLARLENLLVKTPDMSVMTKKSKLRRWLENEDNMKTKINSAATATTTVCSKPSTSSTTVSYTSSQVPKSTHTVVDVQIQSPSLSLSNAVDLDESNSIDKELNHFRPVRAFARTPPKRHTTGQREDEPPLIKCTPRNLRQVLLQERNNTPENLNPEKLGGSPTMQRRILELQAERQLQVNIHSKATSTSKDKSPSPTKTTNPGSFIPPKSPLKKTVTMLELCSQQKQSQHNTSKQFCFPTATASTTAVEISSTQQPSATTTVVIDDDSEDEIEYLGTSQETPPVIVEETHAVPLLPILPLEHNLHDDDMLSDIADYTHIGYFSHNTETKSSTTASESNNTYFGHITGYDITQQTNTTTTNSSKEFEHVTSSTAVDALFASETMRSDAANLSFKMPSDGATTSSYAGGGSGPDNGGGGDGVGATSGAGRYRKKNGSKQDEPKVTSFSNVITPMKCADGGDNSNSEEKIYSNPFLCAGGEKSKVDMEEEDDDDQEYVGADQADEDEMYGHDDKEYSEPEEDNNEVVELIALETADLKDMNSFFASSQGPIKDKSSDHEPNSMEINYILPIEVDLERLKLDIKSEEEHDSKSADNSNIRSQTGRVYRMKPKSKNAPTSTSTNGRKTNSSQNSPKEKSSSYRRTTFSAIEKKEKTSGTQSAVEHKVQMATVIPKHMTMCELDLIQISPEVSVQTWLNSHPQIVEHSYSKLGQIDECEGEGVQNIDQSTLTIDDPSRLVVNEDADLEDNLDSASTLDSQNSVRSLKSKASSKSKKSCKKEKGSKTCVKQISNSKDDCNKSLKSANASPVNPSHGSLPKWQIGSNSASLKSGGSKVTGTIAACETSSRRCSSIIDQPAPKPEDIFSNKQSPVSFVKASSGEFTGTGADGDVENVISAEVNTHKDQTVPSSPLKKNRKRGRLKQDDMTEDTEVLSLPTPSKLPKLLTPIKKTPPSKKKMSRMNKKSPSSSVKKNQKLSMDLRQLVSDNTDDNLPARAVNEKSADAPRKSSSDLFSDEVMGDDTCSVPTPRRALPSYQPIPNQNMRHNSKMVTVQHRPPLPPPARKGSTKGRAVGGRTASGRTRRRGNSVTSGGLSACETTDDEVIQQTPAKWQKLHKRGCNIEVNKKEHGSSEPYNTRRASKDGYTSDDSVANRTRGRVTPVKKTKTPVEKTSVKASSQKADQSKNISKERTAFKRITRATSNDGFASDESGGVSPDRGSPGRTPYKRTRSKDGYDSDHSVASRTRSRLTPVKNIFRSTPIKRGSAKKQVEKERMVKTPVKAGRTQVSGLSSARKSRRCDSYKEETASPGTRGKATPSKHSTQSSLLRPLTRHRTPCKRNENHDSSSERESIASRTRNKQTPVKSTNEAQQKIKATGFNKISSKLKNMKKSPVKSSVKESHSDLDSDKVSNSENENRTTRRHQKSENIQSPGLRKKQDTRCSKDGGREESSTSVQKAYKIVRRNQSSKELVYDKSDDGDVIQPTQNQARKSSRSINRSKTVTTELADSGLGSGNSPVPIRRNNRGSNRSSRTKPSRITSDDNESMDSVNGSNDDTGSEGDEKQNITKPSERIVDCNSNKSLNKTTAKRQRIYCFRKTSEVGSDLDEEDDCSETVTRNRGAVTVSGKTPIKKARLASHRDGVTGRVVTVAGSRSKSGGGSSYSNMKQKLRNSHMITHDDKENSVDSVASGEKIVFFVEQHQQQINNLHKSQLITNDIKAMVDEVASNLHRNATGNPAQDTSRENEERKCRKNGVLFNGHRALVGGKRPHSSSVGDDKSNDKRMLDKRKDPYPSSVERCDVDECPDEIDCNSKQKRKMDSVNKVDKKKEQDTDGGCNVDNLSSKSNMKQCSVRKMSSNKIEFTPTAMGKKARVKRSFKGLEYTPSDKGKKLVQKTLYGNNGKTMNKPSPLVKKIIQRSKTKLGYNNSSKKKGTVSNCDNKSGGIKTMQTKLAFIVANSEDEFEDKRERVTKVLTFTRHKSATVSQNIAANNKSVNKKVNGGKNSKNSKGMKKNVSTRLNSVGSDDVFLSPVVEETKKKGKTKMGAVVVKKNGSPIQKSLFCKAEFSKKTANNSDNAEEKNSAKPLEMCDFKSDLEYQAYLEEQDRIFALSLQADFDLEAKFALNAIRKKGSADEYKLRGRKHRK